MKLLALKLAFAACALGGASTAMACTPSAFPPLPPVGHIAVFNSAKCVWVFVKFSDLVKPVEPNLPMRGYLDKTQPGLVPDVTIDLFPPLAPKKVPSKLDQMTTWNSDAGGRVYPDPAPTQPLKEHRLRSGIFKLGTQDIGG